MARDPDMDDREFYEHRGRLDPSLPAGWSSGSSSPKEWVVNDIADAERVIRIQHRMLCKDAEFIADLYERVQWLALPWHRRAFRRPPWLRRPAPKTPRSIP